jgi:predicted dithiol-disulfide oxidoreductase (DUF899 family)
LKSPLLEGLNNQAQHLESRIAFAAVPGGASKQMSIVDKEYGWSFSPFSSLGTDYQATLISLGRCGVWRI